MRLKELFEGIVCRYIQGNSQCSIKSIQIDSRLIEEGDIFVAIPGANADGHDFAVTAAMEGAAAILVCDEGKTERILAKIPEETAILIVEDTRAILSKIVNRFYGHPSEKFALIGITGTNGKTSTAAMADHILSKLGKKTGVLGTIDNHIGGEVMQTRRTTPTTPDCVELGEIMNEMAIKDVDALIMEVSSMGLKTNRVADCRFDVGVFTNISPEHLDDHGTMNDYKESKMMLMLMVPQVVVNLDDELSSEILDRTKATVIGFGIGARDHPGIYAENIEYLLNTVSFTVVYNAVGGKRKRLKTSVSTPSEFAVYNALAALGICIALGIDLESAAEALSEPIQISGRFETIHSDTGVTAIVDYAHTAKALEKLLMAVRANPQYLRVISVFGCGGDRDSSKREPMGKISGTLADISIVTSDNPRMEDPETIVDEILVGMKRSSGVWEKETDRRKAIFRAIQIAEPGDVVVISGKGHEDYQILGKEKIHFDDKEVVAEALEGRSL
jgi:UDP-N-acetylmuramoyl-L-alanyl-D-glutamate--2,6-diaminopimelate ligase